MSPVAVRSLVHGLPCTLVYSCVFSCDSMAWPADGAVRTSKSSNAAANDADADAARSCPCILACVRGRGEERSSQLARQRESVSDCSMSVARLLNSSCSLIVAWL